MSYQVICAGEMLVDLISDREVEGLQDVAAFNPIAGGSPANLATNLRHLGVSAGLVASVGRDAFGDMLLNQASTAGLSTDLIHRSVTTPSTLVTVTRSATSPSFEVYRGADQELQWTQFAPLLKAPPKVFHTTCFGLSGLPARSHITRAAQVFAKAGTRLSIDANYAEKVWPDRARAKRVVRRYIAQGALVKMSEVDWQRLFEEELTLDNCEAKGRDLLTIGAHLVCFTFGGDGACVISAEETVRLSPKPVKVVDSTGAGDSFWSGFLAAYLAGETPARCLATGINVAAVKLQQLGPLSGPLDWKRL